MLDCAGDLSSIDKECDREIENDDDVPKRREKVSRFQEEEGDGEHERCRDDPHDGETWRERRSRDSRFSVLVGVDRVS